MSALREGVGLCTEMNFGEHHRLLLAATNRSINGVWISVLLSSRTFGEDYTLWEGCDTTSAPSSVLWHVAAYL